MAKNNKLDKADFIDVEKVFKDKNPGLAKWIPGFVFSLIKRIVHQKEINNFLKENRNLEGIDFLNAIISFFNIKIDIKGSENLVDDKRFEFVSNHPLGGMEGIVLMKVIAQRYGDVFVPANDILMKIENISCFFIPINSYGSKSRDGVVGFEKSYASDRQVMIFPAGFVSRKIDGKIQDIEWRKTFIAKAIQHKRDIIPVYIEGRNSRLFYNIGSFRKIFGIKANLETFLLPDEMFKQRNKTIGIIFGKAVSHTVFDKRFKTKEWAALFREYVYKLPDNKDLEFEQFLKSKL